jgi:AcrR family transcriptional regulator
MASGTPAPSDGEAAPMRADARRNRQQVLAAAKELFAEHGPDIPMEEIARRAGVGVGTLYRRFPDREALIRDVAKGSFAGVMAESRAAEAEEPTGWQALVRILRQSRELQLSVQLAVTSPTAGDIIKRDVETQGFRDSLLATLERVVRAAQAEGSLRGDVGAGDVGLLLVLLMRQGPRLGDEAAFSFERCLGIMMDGLQARPGAPLPGAPLGADVLRPHD